MEQTLINFDILPLYEKWFEDLKSSMKDNGALPGIIPSPDWGFNCGPVCDCLLYELPYRVYLYTGNSHMLTDAIPYFERYIEYLSEKLAQEDFIFSLGDWMGYANSTIVPKRFVQEFYLIKSMKITAFAHTIAKSNDSQWGERCKKVSEDFMNRYLDETGRCVIDEQSSVAMMLEMGLYRDRQVLCDQLISVVLRDQLSLSCGMVGVQYLYDALTHSGRADLAYKMITESKPGYSTWFGHGATTLWERWAGEEDGSHNHHMFSGVIAWFYKSLLGIEPMQEHPAFEQLDLHPCFIEEVGFVKGKIESIRGLIEVEWHFDSGEFLYTVTIPEGIRAVFREQPLVVGKNEFHIKKEILSK